MRDIFFEGNAYKVMDSKHNFRFNIDSTIDAEEAVCSDPRKCVIARAIVRAFQKMGFYDYLIHTEIGSSIARFYHPGVCMRFSMPSVLRKALQDFDRTGKWNLPDGDYVLYAVNESSKLGARTHRANSWVVGDEPVGKGQSNFKARAIPTRRIANLCSI